jgi:2-keto-4-pentenoate hydratase
LLLVPFDQGRLLARRDCVTWFQRRHAASDQVRTSSMTISIETAVERLIDARSSHRPLAPFSETCEDLTVQHAYTIQDALRAALVRRGDLPIGWKLGATSPSGQTIMAVKEPLSGFLPAHQYADGAEVSVSGFVGLAVEAEVAFRMRAKLVGPGVTAATAQLAVEGAVAALEVADFIFSGKPTVADFIASSLLARAIVLAKSLTSLERLDLAKEEVVFEHNGGTVGIYTAAEVMGNPLNALAWLANHLATRGFALEPGDIIMSGAISKLLRPKVGDTIRADFSRLVGEREPRTVRSHTSAASQQTLTADVRVGSKASDRRAGRVRGMSAVPLIATEL